MYDRLNELDVDPEIARNECDFCLGLGYALSGGGPDPHWREESGNSLWRAASNFRRAGATALLLDDAERSDEAFRQAATLYQQFGSPYMFLMAGLASRWTESEFSGHGGFDHFQTGGAEDVYLSLGGAAGVHGGDDEDHVIREVYAGAPVGILGIPVSAHAALTAALRNGDTSDGALAAALMPFIAAFDSALRFGMANRYHWRRLALPFHPAEPDVLGVLVLAQMSLLRNRRRLQPALDRIPISPLAQGIIEDTLDLRFGGGGVIESVRALARKYERERASRPPGPERTAVMQEITNEMRSLPLQTLVPEQLLRSTSPGERLAAIAFLQTRPERRHIDWLAERVTSEVPFIAYQSAVALHNAVTTLPEECRDHLRNVLAKARAELERKGAVHSNEYVELRRAEDQIAQSG
jgi:hypothetical protein